MVGGFNTNIRYEGRTYHVQTEDSGEANPQIVTLLYQGGAILYSKKQSYADVLDGGDVEAAVRGLMERQHRSVVEALKNGELDDSLGSSAEAATSSVGETVERGIEFGADIITDTPLDELVLEHLGAA